MKEGHKMLYSEEQIQRANECSITEYFRQAGYSCKRVGSETHIEGFGGFYVNETTIPNKFYIHSQQKGGVGACKLSDESHGYAVQGGGQGCS